MNNFLKIYLDCFVFFNFFVIFLINFYWCILFLTIAVMVHHSSVCSTLYLCNKISIRKLWSTHIQLFCFPFNVSYYQNKNLTFFTLIPPMQVFLVGFSYFLQSIDWINPTILVYCSVICKSEQVIRWGKTNHRKTWTHLRRLAIEISHRMFTDVSSIMKGESTSKRWHWFHVDNSTSIQLLK